MGHFAVGSVSLIIRRLFRLSKWAAGGVPALADNARHWPAEAGTPLRERGRGPHRSLRSQAAGLVGVPAVIADELRELEEKKRSGPTLCTRAWITPLGLPNRAGPNLRDLRELRFVAIPTVLRINSDLPSQPQLGIWTGGTEYTDYGIPHPMGTTRPWSGVQTGFSTYVATRDVYDNNEDPATYSNPIYALSSPITVPVPEPTSLNSSARYCWDIESLICGGGGMYRGRRAHGGRKRRKRRRKRSERSDQCCPRFRPRAERACLGHRLDGETASQTAGQMSR